MYSRRLGKRTLLFGHEGILYKRSFVMYDRSTKSLWLHVTGTAVKGPRKGEKLKFLPSTVMEWGAWKLRYPLTTVLEGRMAGGMMGAYKLRERRDRYGLSLGEGKDVKLYRFADLAKSPVVHDTFGGIPVVIVYDEKLAVARAYEAGGRTFTRKDGKLVDGTGRAWDPIVGRSADGKESLVPVLATVWLIERWHGHNPDGAEYEAAE